jgi:hypothetical protein
LVIWCKECRHQRAIGSQTIWTAAVKEEAHHQRNRLSTRPLN